MTTKNTKKMPDLPAESAWIKQVDVAALEKDFRELGNKLEAAQGPADVAHLEKIIFWANCCTFLGWLTMALPYYYVFPAVFLSLGTFARWTMIGHHVSHGGYNNCTAPDSRYKRFRFAVGSVFQRLSDWPDWMLPEAWDVEHNHLHHYALNEDNDPDLVERNLGYLREVALPLPLKYVIVGVFMASWKWFYYAVNTFALLRMHETGTHSDKTFFTLMDFVSKDVPKALRFTEYFIRVALPYIIYQFFLLPLPLMLGSIFLKESYPAAAALCSVGYTNALVTLVISDVITNFHAFVAIVTNHAGDDMYRYTTHCNPLSGSFYLRAIVSSANYSAGTDHMDFMHGWLNYQIEHHCFPKLSMLSYQKAMPQVKALCKKHGVPYVQQSVWIRLKKTVDSMVGVSTMRSIPLEWEKHLNQEE